MHFGPSKLAEIAAAYDPASDPAPLVIGHPQLDHPAYGWVESLTVEDGELIATPSDIEPSFAEAVRKRRYAKVSPRFYTPGHPGNPKPGTWYLKHIGFLGAHAPGIKGLGTVAFSEGDDQGVATFEFSNSKDASMNKDALEASFAERETALGERERTLNEREQNIGQREEAQRVAATKALHEGNVSFAEGMVADLKLAPAGRGLLVGVLDHLDTTGVVSFGEAGDMTPAGALKKLLSSAAPLLDLGERGKKPAEQQPYVSFAAPDGYEVDPDKADLHARATRIQQEHPELSWMQAVARAQAG
ncbi:hypothetical protein SAMN02927924_01364 [Sphingobium faniae]|nr:hypothetical protein SAMN02927924_01364 [Sphingobium faniae]